MFVQQQVAVVVACVWRVPAVVCVREELLLLERDIAAPVLSRPSARTLRSRFTSQRALHRSAVLLLHTAVLFPGIFPLPQHPRLHFFSNLFILSRGKSRDCARARNYLTVRYRLRASCAYRSRRSLGPQEVAVQIHRNNTIQYKTNIHVTQVKHRLMHRDYTQSTRTHACCTAKHPQ